MAAQIAATLDKDTQERARRVGRLFNAIYQGHEDQDEDETQTGTEEIEPTTEDAETARGCDRCDRQGCKPTDGSTGSGDR